jgi:hypothetical protein
MYMTRPQQVQPQLLLMPPAQRRRDGGTSPITFVATLQTPALIRDHH